VQQIYQKKITLGFKFLSGKYENGVKKEDIDKLGRNKNIKWNSEYEDLVQDINSVIKLVLSTEYFKFLKSWKFSVMDNLSDAIALNFLLIMYKDWIKKDKPIGSDTKTKQFQKNAFILFDTLIYEYITKQWRGSSDSKIAKNLQKINNENEIFTYIEEDKWIDLLEEIINNNTIDGDFITQKIMQPILYHFYAISKISGPSTEYAIEVDHIIPQSLFKSSALQNSDTIVHNIYNLGLLPKDDNISKSNKKLTEITNKWLIEQIEKYEFIKEDEYRKFSDLNNFNLLKEYRGKIIIKAFKEKRNQILNNT
jgi:hypothetical protein